MRPQRLVLILALLGASTARAGVFDDDEARRRIEDLRVKSEARFDQVSRSQLDLASQLSRQAEEIARLQGQIETLNYELENTRKRQQDFYLDLDTRLRRLETPATNAAAPTEGGSPTAAADPAQENGMYEAALGHIKAGKYKEAASAFAGFIDAYPASALLPNAWFWQGNAWVAQRNCAKAIDAHNVVVSKFPDSNKAPDALLAVATCQQDMGNVKAAKASLDALVARYPNAAAAETARQRLKKK